MNQKQQNKAQKRKERRGEEMGLGYLSRVVEGIEVARPSSLTFLSLLFSSLLNSQKSSAAKCKNPNTKSFNFSLKLQTNKKIIFIHKIRRRRLI